MITHTQTHAATLDDLDAEVAELKERKERERRRAVIDGRTPDVSGFDAEIAHFEARRASARARVEFEAAAPARQTAFLAREAALAPDVVAARNRIRAAVDDLIAELDAVTPLVAKLEANSVDASKGWVIFKRGSRFSGSWFGMMRARELREEIKRWQVLAVESVVKPS